MNKIKANYLNPLSYYKIACFLKDYMNQDTVIVCIGTDRCIGDCLGPLVGTLLVKNEFPLPVCGTLKDPIHALNIEKKLKELKKAYPISNIIGIDACIGDVDSVGEIQARDCPVHPGKGVGKSLPKIGDTSIIGIVDSNSNNDLFTSNTIRLSFISDMSIVILHSLIHAYHMFNESKTRK